MSDIFRVQKNTNYVTMGNYHLRDKGLSLRAKGLLSLILSLPPGWDFSVRGLAAITMEGKQAIASTLNELEAGGYLTKRQLRAEGGCFGKTEYVIYERSQKKREEAEEKEEAKPPCPGRQDTVKSKENQGVAPCPGRQDTAGGGNRKMSSDTSCPGSPRPGSPCPGRRDPVSRPQISKDLIKDRENNKDPGGGKALAIPKTQEKEKETTSVHKPDQGTTMPVSKSGGMSEKEFRIIEKTINAAYLSSPMRNAKKRGEYYGHLRDLPYSEVLESLKKHIQTCRFAPTVLELRGEMVGANSETVRKHPKPGMELTEVRKCKIASVREKYALPEEEGENAIDLQACRNSAQTYEISKEQFAALVGAVQDLYAQNPMDTGKKQAVWYELLKDMPYAALLENLLKHAASCPYAPTISELRGEVTDDSKEKGKGGNWEGHNMPASRNKFNNFPQRDYDFEELERMLLNA